MKKAFYKTEVCRSGLIPTKWYLIYIRNSDNCGMGHDPSIDFLFSTKDEKEALEVCNRLNG